MNRPSIALPPPNIAAAFPRHSADAQLEYFTEVYCMLPTWDIVEHTGLSKRRVNELAKQGIVQAEMKTIPRKSDGRMAPVWHLNLLEVRQYLKLDQAGKMAWTKERQNGYPR